MDIFIMMSHKSFMSAVWISNIYMEMFSDIVYVMNCTCRICGIKPLAKALVPINLFCFLSFLLGFIE